MFRIFPRVTSLTGWRPRPSERQVDVQAALLGWGWGLMDSTVQDITQIRVPPPDEVLQKAFADLDAGFASWKAALAELRALIVEQAQRQAETHQSLQAKAEQYAQLQAELESRIADQSQAGQQLTAQAARGPAEREWETREQAPDEGTEQAEVRSPASRTQDAGAPGTQPLDTPVDWDSDAISKHVRVYGDAAKAMTGSRTKAEAPQANEDETLLASLDPETAKAIRVMRRVSGHRKSVRELLEQYQASQAHGKTEPAKKSWFRRGR